MKNIRKNKKGMSLAELLVVIAIGAIITIIVVAILTKVYNGLPWDMLE